MQWPEVSMPGWILTWPPTARLFSRFRARVTCSASSYSQNPKGFSAFVSGSSSRFHSLTGPHASSSCVMRSLLTLGEIFPTYSVVAFGWLIIGTALATALAAPAQRSPNETLPSRVAGQKALDGFRKCCTRRFSAERFGNEPLAPLSPSRSRPSGLRTWWEQHNWARCRPDGRSGRRTWKRCCITDKSLSLCSSQRAQR